MHNTLACGEYRLTRGFSAAPAFAIAPNFSGVLATLCDWCARSPQAIDEQPDGAGEADADDELPHAILRDALGEA